MLPLFTREAVRELDRDAIERLGVPGLVLMENAGAGAYETICQRFADLSRVLLVCGPGQNGGDGYVVARRLLREGHTPIVVLLCDPEAVKGDARVNLDALQELDADVRVRPDLPELQTWLGEAGLVVDAIFGTGLTREVRDAYRDVIDAINRASAPTVALDLPSGLDADSGAVLGVAVRAQLTVTFAAHKQGLVLYPAAELSGEVVCVDIGVPTPRVADNGLIEPDDVAAWLPERAPDSHKGSAGHVLVVAGSPGRTGAALLAGLGAQRGGAGLVTLAPRGGARDTLDAKVVEMMTAALPRGADSALELARDKKAAVLGPGLGVDDRGLALAKRLALELPLPTVLDADALTALVGELSGLKRAAAGRVLTPHPGEAGRLLSVGSSQVQADRYGAARRLAELSGAVVTLKGARTVVAEPGGRMAVCARGTPALASGGTGDVLAGLVGALLCALEPFEAAAAAVYLHALAGELAAVSDRGLLAREVADAIPQALELCRGGVAAPN